MKRNMKRFTALLLAVTMLFTSVINAFASEGEEYLLDLRIVYGDSLEDAEEKLAKSAFSNYKLFEYNLNEDTEAQMGFIGLGEEPHVYIAYQTTTVIEDAITDIAVMDMEGGYSEGNLQAMLDESMEEYREFAGYYIKAIEYFRTVYDSGSRLADAAYRQLNLYFDPDSKLKFGEVLFQDISDEALATILLQGNINILENMKSLLAMGVSYNENGKSYLEVVEEKAAEADADSEVFADNNWYEIGKKVSGTFGAIRDLIYEYNSVEDTLDYTDEEYTEEELQYLEFYTIKTMLEETQYMGGVSLADFICNYQGSNDGYLSVYPLIAAMNDGQKAMAELCQFYNIVRYSTTDLAADVMEEQIVELEEKFQDGISIYLGVDRNLYSGTFAVTNAAERAAATSGRDIASDVFGRSNAIASYIVSGTALLGNIGLLVYNLKKISAAADAAAKLSDMVDEGLQKFSECYFEIRGYDVSSEATLNILGKWANLKFDSNATLFDKAAAIGEHYSKVNPYAGADEGFYVWYNVKITYDRYSPETILFSNKELAQQASSTSLSMAGAFAIFGGITLGISALNIGIWLYNKYNPELTDIPTALVDMIETEEGDRYIYYDAVKMIDSDNDPACLNAFEGVRWNALYFTRSYEAGNPLLTNFDISYDSQYASDGYISVHKFGDTVGFDLNKHTFGGDTQIYLSVAQSENQKWAEDDIPDVIGTMISAGELFLAAGAGILLGMGVVLVFQKKRKKENTIKNE